jgi:DNA-binding response OmpR family regulator
MAGEKVLIADDNRQIRMLVSAALRSGGYVIVEAVDGEAALEAAIAERPDLVLLDVTMPKLDGFEVLHLLRKRPETAGCRVILLTTAGTLADIKHGLDEGACDYLVKPFEPAHLREAVGKALAT